jgi:predicted CxxxxCH...CXXCH cytochrome family protein
MRRGILRPNLLPLWVAIGCLASAVAYGQVVFQAAGTAANGTNTISPAWPAHQVGDVALLFVEAAGGQAISLQTANGFVGVLNSPQSTGTGTAGTRLAVFWARATSSSMPAPVVADPGDHAYGVILTFRGVVESGDPWDVTGGGSKGTASTSVTVPSITTSVANTLVVVAVTKDLDAVAAFASGWTNANLTSITERFDAGTNSGNGGGIAVMDGGMAAAGSTGDTTATVTSSVNAFMAIALKPQVGTIAGTVTASSSGCTQITVNAPYTGDSDGDNTLSYRYRTPSGTGGWSSSTNLSHSASPYNFTLSGLTHGATYDVEVTYVDADGVTGTNPQTVSNILVGGNCTGAGTVTAAQAAGATPSIAVSATYTFDNNGNNTLRYRTATPAGSGNWTGWTNLSHSASPYAFTISGLACGSSYDVQVEYQDADGIGSGTAVQTVSNIVLTNCTTAGTPSAVVDTCTQITVSAPFTNDANANGSTTFERGPTGAGPWAAACSNVAGASPRTCVDTGVAESSTYYYRVTYADADGVGGTAQSVIGPFTTPACAVNGVTPGVPTAAVDTCSQITVSSPYTGDSNGNSTTTVEYNTSNTWPGTIACNAQTGASPRVCVVGSLQNATAYWFRVTFADADGVTGSNPQVIGPFTTHDCKTTAGAASGTVDACSQITVSAPFTGDWDADGSTAVRRGTAVGGPFGTVICNALVGASPRTCVDSTASGASTYYYQVDFTDADGVNGTDPQVIGPFTTPACGVNNTTVGTHTAAASSCKQITVTAYFTGDDNGNGATLVQYKRTADAVWSTGCAALTGPSPRQCIIPGLSASTSYDLRVDFTDADGVSGTDPQTITPVTTPACGADQTAPMVLYLSPAEGAVVGGTERVKVQVYEPTAPSGGIASVQWKVDAGPLAPAAVNPNYAGLCGTDCAVYEFDLDTTLLSNGAHSLTVVATDTAAPTANITTVTRAVRINNAGGKPAGSGTLLRRSHGAQLCLDCHALPTHSSQATSDQYGSWAVDCLVCHTAHDTSNIYLVRETIRTPNSGLKAVKFWENATGLNYLGDTAGTYDDGLCEVCHTRTDHYRNDTSGGDHTHNQSSACTSCHKHGEGFAGAGCNGCHKAPPTVGRHGAHDEVWDSTDGNTATSYTDTASHATATQYGYACAKCHAGTHVNDTHTGAAGDPYRVEVAFDNTADPKNGAASYAQTYPGTEDQGVDTTKYWSWSNGTCSNAYCHSNATPVGGVLAYQTPAPTWDGAATTCSSCHAATGATAAGQTTLSQKHASHINGGAGNYTFTCDECHALTVQNDSSSVLADKTLHVNGVKDWRFSTTATAGAVNQSAGTYDMAGTKTCSGTYCHSQGTTTTPGSFLAPNTALAWTAGTAACDSCHGGNAAAANTMSTFAHAAHMNQAAYLGSDFMCFRCHQDTVSASSDTAINTVSFHVNGARDVKLSNGGAYAAWACSNSYCHSSGQAVAAPIAYYDPPTWNSGTALANDCKACHGRHADNAFVSVAGEPNYTNGGAGNVKANSHQKHVSAASDCADCHNNTTLTGTVILGGSTIHIDTVRDVHIAPAWDTNGGTKSDNYNAATKTCSSIQCHGAGSPQWGGPSLTCGSCHLHATTDTNDWVYNNGTMAQVSQSEWTAVGHGQAAIGLGGANPCLYCHEDSAGHGVGTNPFRLNGATTDATALPGAFNAAVKNGNDACLNCHGTGSFGVDPDGASGGYAKVNGTKKVDAWHYGADHAAAQDGGMRCWDCHDGHGDGSNIKMIGSDTLRDGADAYGLTGTRSTTAAVFTANAAPTDYAKTSAPFNGICQVCHTTTNHWRADGTLNTHQTGVKCTACHQHDNATANLAFTAPTACNGCHNAPPTLGKHAQHDEVAPLPTDYTVTASHATATQYGYACGQCHTAVIGNHMDDLGGTAADPYVVDVDFQWDATTYTPGGTSANETHAATGLVYKSTNGACTNSYCHDPQGAVYNANTAVTWTTAGPLACTGCHDDGTAQATTLLPNAHAKHITNAAGSYSYGCEKCHANTTTTGNTITGKDQHADNSKDVKFNASPLDQSAGTFSGGAAGTCSNTYCHSNGQDRTAPFTSGPSIAWNATADVECDSCHGGNASASVKMGPSNDHAAHMDQAAYLGRNIACGRCHSATVNQSNDRVITTLANHVNAAADVAMVNVDETAAGTYSGPGTKTCTNVYCHSDGTETLGYINTNLDWDAGFAKANDCKACHGTEAGSVAGAPWYANNTASNDTRNSHQAHVGAATDCVDCHAGTVTAAGALIAGGTLHLNKVVEVSGAAIGSYTDATETCNTVTCHGGGSPQWGATLTCRDCHMPASAAGDQEVDDYTYGNGTTARIDRDDWYAYGHGATAAFAESGNTAPNFDNGNPGTRNGCLYCHTTGVLHNVAANPFRLANIGAGSTVAEKNGVCTVCHGGTGYDPDGGGAMASIDAPDNIDAWHYGAAHSATGDGGQFCWDCHDPHGDYNYGSTQRLAYMIEETPTQDHSGSAGWGIPTTLAPTPDFRYNRDGSGSQGVFSWGDYVSNTLVSGTYRGICQVCHTSTSVSHFRQTQYNATHNNTSRCTTSCHTHDQPSADAFKPAGGDCKGCHGARTGAIPRAQIVGGTAGNEGDDFIRASRHVSNGDTTEIVTNLDCILCHAEGSVASTDTNIQTVAANHGADGGTTTVDLRNVDSSGGTGIQVAWPGKRLAAFTATTANRDNMDSFCMGCHDANGASNVAVNASNTGLDTSTTGAAARRLTPFNTADNLQPSRESWAAMKSSRTRVIDVKGQFNSTNQAGKAWASHHNLNQFTKRYSTNNTTHLPNTAWTNYTTKEGKVLNSGAADSGVVAGFHCSDCHLNEVNAHGSRNTWYMLSNASGADAAFTNSGYPTSTDICMKCHNPQAYGEAGTSSTTAPRTDAHDGDCGRVDGDQVFSNRGASIGYGPATPHNIACLLCHGGLEPGMIHGTNSTYEPWDPTPDGTGVSKRFRFMGTGGSMRWYSPNGAAFPDNTSDALWEASTQYGCYTLSSADTYGACTQHSGGRNGNAVNRARPLEY